LCQRAGQAEGALPSEPEAPDLAARLLSALQSRLLAAAPFLAALLRAWQHRAAPQAPPQALPPLAWHPATPRLAAADSAGGVHVYEVTLGGAGGAKVAEDKVLCHARQRLVRERCKRRASAPGVRLAAYVREAACVRTGTSLRTCCCGERAVCCRFASLVAQIMRPTKLCLNALAAPSACQAVLLHHQLLHCRHAHPCVIPCVRCIALRGGMASPRSVASWSE